jgi:hypothetical protein
VETLKQTMQFAQGLGASYGFNVLSPFPGTEVREKAAEYGIEILTNDWTKYDCNRPLTRTKDAGPEEINAFLQQYFEGLNKYLAQLEKESGASQGESAKEKRRSPLSIAILKGDVIENLTAMKPEGNPVEALVSKVVELVPYSHQQVKEDITKWVDKGLLKYTIKDGHLVWDWA